MYLFNPTVSVIVPVYQAQDTLGRCVDSILKQSFKDLELILVDDGSRDHSPAICDLYARRDGRVRVIHKENSGVSDTRNRGIAEAIGEYIQFVDSDDWLSPDATEQMVTTAKRYQADLVVADFFRVSGNLVAKKHREMPENPLSCKQYAQMMMKDPASFYIGVLWNKLYRREIIAQQKMKMNPELRICEDLLFNLEYLRFVKTAATVDVPVYYYVRTANSLVARADAMSTLRVRTAAFQEYKQFYLDVLDEKEYQKVRRKVYRFLLDVATDGVVLPRPAPNTRSLKPMDVPDEEWPNHENE